MTNCPVCNTTNIEYEEAHPLVTFRSGMNLWKCPRCGWFYAESPPIWNSDPSDKDRALISHYIRKGQDEIQKKKENIPVITSRKIEGIIKDSSLPDVAEQINLVIDYIGKKSEFLGQTVELNANDKLALEAYAGCVNSRSLKVILAELKESGFLTEYAPPRYSLAIKGWQKYEEIKKGKTESKKAFMAMKFDKSHDDMYSKFQKAVEKTGFVLNRLDEFAEPGLIDVRMYQRIKTCKFVIADLSDGNQGAYWEAGYAAGLGKKVIYTCQKSVFDADKTKEIKVIHFDVSHHQIILWDENNLQDAIEKLKAMIRVTFPEDAIQEDKNDEAA